MSATRLTLLDIYHPAFRKGYQDGRQLFFLEKTILIDKQLVECLQEIFEECGQDEEGSEREEGVYYAVGHLVGQLSGCVIPRQPTEDDSQLLQEWFLVKVVQMYGEAGQALAESVGQFWKLQDELAMRLEADLFEQMLGRGLGSYE